MDAYRLDELRLVQEYSASSAAAATFHDCTDFVVPANFVRTILFLSYIVDMAENKWVTVKLITPSGQHFTIRGPVSHDGNNGAPLAVLEQGLEVRLLPGDRLRFDRSSATAGSVMTLRARYIDHILPYQQQYEPQSARTRKSPFMTRAGFGGSFGGGEPSGSGGGGGEPGEGGGGEPVL